jgi:hypothetical protein
MARSSVVPDRSSEWRTEALRADLAAQMRGARARQIPITPASPELDETAQPQGPMAVLLFGSGERARRIRLAVGTILLVGVFVAFAAAGAEGLLLPDAILMAAVAMVYAATRAWGRLSYRPVSEPSAEQIARVREQLDRAAGAR